MAQNLCYRCARSAGYSTNAEIELLLDSQYQVEKFIKHTRPDRIFHINSIFADSSSDAYREFVINAAAAGSVEIDDRGKPNFIWVAGEEVGATYEDGILHYPADAIKLVLPFDSLKIHAFPIGSSSVSERTCSNCGAPIIG